MPLGHFVWYDLNTTDTTAAADFYTQVVGWGTEQWDGPNDYTMWTTPDTQVGGLMTLPEEAKKMGAPPHWLAYVEVADIDAVAARVEESGGGVLAPPFDIPTVGRVAILRDPQGAVFAGFAPLGEMTVRSGPGHHTWAELSTADSAAAMAWYCDVAGWTPSSEMDMGDGDMYRMFTVEGRENSLGGMMTKPAQMPMSAWLHYVEVADLDPTLAKVAELGGRVLNGPTVVPGGDRVAQCMDPQGAMFAVFGKGGA